MRIKPVFLVLAATALGIGGLVNATATGARAGITLCQYQTAPAAAGTYIVQNDEWGSSADECVTTDGRTDFTVAHSAIANGPGGAPGGYPSIFAGCHWGDCTSGGLAAHPLLLADLRANRVTSSWSTAQQAGGADSWDAAYDIWINQTPATSGAPDGTEVMIWLNHHGSVQPAGSMVAAGAQVGAYRYDIWYRPAAGGAADIVTYDMITPRTKVTNLDLDPLLMNARRLGYTEASWYLISVEAGFELWAGGTGLATRYFSVDLGTNKPLSAGRAELLARSG